MKCYICNKDLQDEKYIWSLSGKTVCEKCSDIYHSSIDDIKLFKMFYIAGKNEALNKIKEKFNVINK